MRYSSTWIIGGNSNSKAGFDKTYKNFALKIGVIVGSYPVNNEKNRSKLTTEYDVVVMEQSENKVPPPLCIRIACLLKDWGQLLIF